MTSLKIKVENLHKSFDKKKVLDGVNLEVQDKESLVILGGSGSGNLTGAGYSDQSSGSPR